ncbi:MAG: hypothetical protein UH241_10260 [Acutalibacteraceae bacterium]|nr:hypothetical protein [Acutalibacteraceae bacterium]
MEGGTIAMTVESVIADVSTLLNTAVTTMGENPIIKAFLGITLVGAAAGLFARLRHSAT